MSSAATTAQSAPGQLDLYQLRDDLAKTYRPVNAHERMLVTEIAYAWLRLERAHELEKRYFETHDMLDIIRTKLAEFKALTRYVTDCERAWRHATVNLQRSQRQRMRANLASPNARRSADRPASPPAIPTPLPAAPPAATLPYPHRE
jgi:hypothetical protein